MSDNTTEHPIRILSQLKANYVGIPHLIIDLYGPGMKQALAGYVLLNRFINWESSETKAGLRTLAATGGVDTETIQRWAKHLENLGLLKITPGDSSTTTTYLILMPPFPPPDHIVKEYFPKGWTPPDRAKSTLEKINLLINFGGQPQSEGGTKKGVGTMPTPKPTPDSGTSGVGTTPTHPGGEVSASSPPGVGTMPTGRRHPTPEVSAPRPQYKHSLTNSKQETNNNSDDVVLDAMTRLTAQFKTKDPVATEDDLKGHYNDCLECCEGDRDRALDYLEEKINVVLAMKDPQNPQAVLVKAINGDWKPTFKPGRESSLDKIEKQRREADAEKERLRQEREGLKKAPEKTIFEFFRNLPENVFSFDKRLRMTGAEFEGNPIIEECLERIRKGTF